MSGKHSKASPRSGRWILLVDEQPLLREGIRHCLSCEPDLEVCGEAETAEQALEAVQRFKPDLVVLDLCLPGRSGLELIKDLKASSPELPVLVFSMQEESLYASRALRAGARGYLMKRTEGQRLREAIRTVLAGGIAVSPEMGVRLLEEYSQQPRRAGRTPLPSLTDREFEVFQLMGEAKTNREIAQELHLSPKTVETHRLSLRGKFGVGTSAELLRVALQYVDRESKLSSRGKPASGRSMAEGLR